MACDDGTMTVSVELAPGTARVASEQAARAGVSLGEYVSGLVAGEVERRRPWRFEIEFDEQRAAAHGTTVDELYGRMGTFVEPYGNVRVARGTWQAREGADEFGAQPVALARLVRERWVMQSVRAITYCEDGVEGDYLDVVRRVSPRLICD